MANKITIKDAKIIFRNFSGAANQYNAEGNRRFSVLIPDNMMINTERLVDILTQDGWNLKYTKSDDPEAYLDVKVSYRNYAPKIVLVTKEGKQVLTEDEVDVLDHLDIEKVDLIITPYNWTMGNKSGITAYLKTMFVTVLEDELEQAYSDIPTIGKPEQQKLDLDVESDQLPF